MAMIGRKEPATQQADTRRAGKPAPAGGQGATASKPGRIDRLREQLRNIVSELRKVTWPTREETRNLTIVVIGISAVLGIGLATLDTVLAFLYGLVR